MKCLKLGLLVFVLGAPATAFAQPDPDYDDRYDTSVSGEPVASVEVFYDQLSPYGVWVDDPDFGQVFIPDHKQFVPYTQGHWQYTRVGFVWISAEPFDWATAHYGRWAYSRSYGRWIWRPDTVWGPSWVEWRLAGDDFGWAPLAPELAISIGYSPPIESWHYCGAAHVLDVNVSRYYEPPRRVIEIHREARPIEHYAQISGARVVVGPSAATLHEHHVTARPTTIELHATGRLAPTEARAAVTRAEEHHAANEVQNRKRIESNPAVRQVQAHVAIAAPHSADGKPVAGSPQVKQEPKTPQGQPEHRQPATQPEHKQPQIQPEPKQPAPPEHKQPQVRPEPKQPAPPEHKQPQPPPARTQPQVQPEHKQPAPPEHKQPQIQPEPKQPAPPEHKQPQVQQEPKPQVRQEPRQEPKPQVRQEPRQEPKPQVRQEPRQEPKPQVRQEPKQEPKPQVRQEPKQDAKPPQAEKESPRPEPDRKRDPK
jgi:hypothetical protein